jgi:hypothetical protein
MVVEASEKTITLKADDGCEYLYDVENKTISKFCKVSCVDDIPASVREVMEKAGLMERVRASMEAENK